MKYEIIEDAVLPEPYKPKPPIRKSKLTDEERKQRRKEAQHRCNSKRTKEYTKRYNDRARDLNTERFQKSVLKARQKTLEKRNKKLEEIAGRPRPLTCEICSDGGKICFDHCHSNHHFRGWICDRCNRVLGLVKDNTETLKKLKLYLEDDMDIPF